MAYTVALVLTLPWGAALAQEKVVTPWDAIEKHEKAIKAVPGVKDITLGGVNGETLVVIRVEDEKARVAVRAICGEKLGPYAVYILVSAPQAQPADSPPSSPPKLARPTVVEERPPRNTEAAPRRTPEDEAKERLGDDTQCDIVRELFKLPPRKELKDPSALRCSWTRRTVIGPGNNRDEAALLRAIPTPPGATPWSKGAGAFGTVWWCDFPKHRGDCPMILRAKLEWVKTSVAPAPPTPSPPPPPKVARPAPPCPWLDDPLDDGPIWRGFPPSAPAAPSPSSGSRGTISPGASRANPAARTEGR